MSKRRTTRAEARAEKKRAKLSSYNESKRDKRPSKYRTRVAARRGGEPMSDRSGERQPWWDQGPGLPLSAEMAQFSTRVRSIDERVA